MRRTAALFVALLFITPFCLGQLSFTQHSYPATGTRLLRADFNNDPRVHEVPEFYCLDPDVWLKNVEIVAAEQIGAETVTYVANIYKYYVAYKLMDELGRGRLRTLETVR